MVLIKKVVKGHEIVFVYEYLLRSGLKHFEQMELSF